MSLASVGCGTPISGAGTFSGFHPLNCFSSRGFSSASLMSPVTMSAASSGE
jgi:hypothetical protein